MKLIISYGDTVKEIDVEKFPFTIGRDKDNSLEVPDPALSKTHIAITADKDSFIVVDAGSKNGTYLNGRRVTTGKIENGDMIIAGDVKILCFTKGKTGQHTSSTKLSLPKFQDVHSIAQTLSIVLPKDKPDRIADTSKLQKMSKREKMFFTLYQISRELFVGSDKLFDQTLQLTLEVLPADRGAIILQNDGSQQVLSSMQRSGPRIVKEDISPSHTIIEECIKSMSPIITEEAGSQYFSESIVTGNIRSVLCVPIWDEQTAYGAFYFDCTAARYKFSEDDSALVIGIANLLANRIKSQKILDELANEQLLRQQLASYYPRQVVDYLIQKKFCIPSEIRNVTVMFVDIVNSTSLCEQTGPDHMTKLLNYFYESNVKFVQKYGGSILEFPGDATLSIFNTPLPLKDHHKMTLKAGIEILDAIKKSPIPFQVRIGVNTGNVMACVLGTQPQLKYAVVGDAINVAARIMKIEAPMQIVLGPETYEATKNDFKFASLGKIELKGKAQPLPVYKLAY